MLLTQQVKELRWVDVEISMPMCFLHSKVLLHGFSNNEFKFSSPTSIGKRKNETQSVHLPLNTLVRKLQFEDDTKDNLPSLTNLTF